MLFTSVISTLATTLAVMAPVVTAAPGVDTSAPELDTRAPELDTRAADFEITWRSVKGCSDNGGPRRTLTRNKCVPLSDTTKAVRVHNHKTGLKIRGYGGGNCEGRAKTAFSSHQCHNLDGIWSVRVEYGNN